MNTRQKGDYSELVLLAELARQERRVALPYGNSQGFDLLVLDKTSAWRMIQVKTAYRRGQRGDRIYVDTIRGDGATSKRRRGYVDGSFDFLIAVLPDERRFWVITFEEMKGRRCLTLPEERDTGWSLLF